MNNPAPGTPPANAVPAAPKPKFTRGAELQQNRNVSHMLKSGAFQQHAAKRSVPHVRGR